MKPYQYKECGLDNVWLMNGFKYVETPEGKGVSISNIRQLNKAIGMTLTEVNRPLKPQEFKFLRVEMDLSQKRLAELIDIDPQTVGRWERGENAVDGAADRLIRLYYRAYCHNNPMVKEFIDRLAELDRSVDDTVKLEQTADGWKQAA